MESKWGTSAFRWVGQVPPRVILLVVSTGLVGRPDLSTGASPPDEDGLSSSPPHAARKAAAAALDPVTACARLRLIRLPSALLQYPSAISLLPKVALRKTFPPIATFDGRIRVSRRRNV